MIIEEKRKSLGKTNKRKGSDAERFYARIFKEDMGFTHCKTSRLGSKLHDDAGIDLIFLPFNVQIKAGKQTGLNFGRELIYMQERMKELFPETSLEHKYPKIVIHKKEVGQGKRRTEFDELVCMTFEDFTKFLQKIPTWST
jgi:hypothetical protein